MPARRRWSTQHANYIRERNARKREAAEGLKRLREKYVPNDTQETDAETIAKIVGGSII